MSSKNGSFPPNCALKNQMAFCDAVHHMLTTAHASHSFYNPVYSFCVGRNKSKLGKTEIEQRGLWSWSVPDVSL